MASRDLILRLAGDGESVRQVYARSIAGTKKFERQMKETFGDPSPTKPSGESGG